MTEQSEKSEKDPRFMTALGRGLGVLKSFSESGKLMGNHELADATGLPRPTISRITYTLTELGYLAKEPESGRYRLAPGVLALGYGVMAQMEIRDIARPFMQELADYGQVSVYLGVCDQNEMVYVESARAPSSMVIRLGVGSRVSMSKTAMGRAWLTAMPVAEREAKLRDLAALEGEAAWSAAEKSLRRSLSDAEARGYAVTIGGWIQESNGAGCAILGTDGLPAYALNLGGLRSLVTEERIHDDLGPRLLALAKRIEQAAPGMI